MRRQARQGGFTPVEVMIAIIILSVVAGGLASGLAFASKLLGEARVQSIGTGLASSALEDVKRMPYSEVGTPGGDPVGSISATREESVDGVTFRVDTAVVLIDDASASGAEAAGPRKRVTVTVTPPGAAAITASTIVGPNTAAAGVGAASVAAQVVDHAGDPVSGLTVTLTLDGATASTGVTNSAGAVSFGGLTPHRLARVSVEGDGYVTMRADRPDRLFKVLRPGRTWEPTIGVYLPRTVTAELRDADSGELVTEAAAVTLIAPDGGVASGATLTGAVTFNGVADASGENPRDIVPNAATAYSVSASADCYLPGQGAGLVPDAVGSDTHAVITVPLERAAGGGLLVSVRRGDGTAIAGATVVVQGPGLGPVSRAAGDAGDVRFCLPPSGDALYTVSASVDGYVATRQAGVADGGEVALTLVQPGRLTVRSGLLGGQVRLQDGTTVRQQPSAPGSGLSVFQDLPPGVYLAAAQGPLGGGWGPDHPVEVQSGVHLGPVQL